MRLKEFWLYLDDDQLDLKYFMAHESLIADSNSDYKEEHNFFLQTRCITGLFERVFEPIETKNCWKLIVNCCKFTNCKTPITVGGVCEVYIQFDYKTYLIEGKENRQKMSLNALMNGIEIAVNHYGWPIEPFSKAQNEVVLSNYKNQWLWKKKIRRNDNAFYVAAEACHEMSCFDLYIILYSQQGEKICRKKAVTEIPDDRLYQRFFGQLVWKSDSEVWLMHKGGKSAVWAAKINFHEEIKKYMEAKE